MIVLDALRPAQEAASQVWLWISGQIMACEEHVRVLKIRSRFLAFPDEILSDVLEFAAYQQDRDEQKAMVSTINAAITLSHVCSRFRRLITSSIGVWSHICPLMCAEAISTCLARCGVAGARIYLSNSSFEEHLVPFIQTIKDSAPSWRHFAHTCDDLASSDFPSHILKLGVIRNQTFQLDAPQLSELAVHYPTSALNTTFFDEESLGKIHFYSSWSVRELRSIIMENIIPVSFAGMNSLTSVSIKLDFRSHRQGAGAFHISALSSFLSSCQVLETLSFGIKKCKASFALKDGDSTEMTTVTSLQFGFIHCYSAVVKSFLNAFRFPNAHKMRLDCDSRGRSLESDMQCQKILHEVFPDSSAFPKLRDLQLGIYAGNGHESYDTASQAFVSDYQRPVSIPFSSMPCLHHFTLTAWDTFLEPLAEETTLPPLRSLALTHCWNIELNWFLDVYTRISSQHANRSSDGRAELSPKVTVIGCPWVHLWEEMRGPACASTSMVDAPAPIIGLDDEGEANVEVNSS